MTQDFEERLRHALNQEAQRVEPGVDDPVADVHQRARRQTRNQRALVGLCVAALLVVAGAGLTPMLRDSMNVEVDQGPVAQSPSEEQTDEPPEGDGEPGGAAQDDRPLPEQGGSAESQPELARECPHPQAGYHIRYPMDWYVNDREGPGSACSWFHPEPFELPDAPQEVTDKAVMVNVDPVPFEQAAEPGGMATAQVLLEEERTVEDRRAVRYEKVANGEGMFAEGTRHYTYVIDMGEGESMIISTHDQVPDVSYEDTKAVIDQMVDSLWFPSPP